MPQLGQGFGLDLTDTLASHIEMLTDFLEGTLFPGLIQAKAHLDDLLLPRSQRREHVLGQLAQVIGDRGFGRIGRPAVFDEAGYGGLAIVPNRSLERDRLLGDLQRFADLPRRHVDAAGEFFVGRLAAEFLYHQALSPQYLVYDLDHMDRDPDGTPLVCNGASYGLTDPPGRISRELVAPAPVELFDSPHQPDIPFLYQVEEVQTAINVILGDRDHESEVGLDHLAFSLFDFGLSGDHGLKGPFDVSRSRAVAAFDFTDDLTSGALLLLELVDAPGPPAVEGSLNTGKISFSRAHLGHDALYGADESPPGAGPEGISANHLGQGHQLARILAP